ncbi:MAG TPA: hypothetical protein VFP78_17570 [Solirubrobacteraceae bacterium]|nr:hypothetical protein [Solirubrobacteraceae bacterium]
MISAHAGHWIVDLLYAAPLLLMVGIFVVARLRERSGRKGTDQGP